MNDGFINESVLTKYINSHFFNSYNDNIKSFLKFAFGDKIDISKPFKAEKIGCRIKPDLCITHNGIKKYISIKKRHRQQRTSRKIRCFLLVYR